MPDQEPLFGNRATTKGGLGDGSQVTIAPHGFAYQMGLHWTSSCAPQANMVTLALPLHLEFPLSSICSALAFVLSP